MAAMASTIGRRRDRLELATSSGGRLGRGGVGHHSDPARARISLFRAIKEDMSQIIEHITRVHGRQVLHQPVTAADVASSSKLRCIFEGLDGLDSLLAAGSGLSPRDFALALIERGYERQRILAMLPVRLGCLDHVCLVRAGGAGAPAEPAPADYLEAHCAALVGTLVTLADHGDVVVLSVCAGGHVKVARQPSGKTTFVSHSAFAPSSSSSEDDEPEPCGIDLSTAQPIRLPETASSPARELAPGEAAAWIADQRAVTWQFQAGTLWSRFDEETTNQLESSLAGVDEVLLADRQSLNLSLMSITSMRAVNANAVHLVNDISKYMQVTVDDADFVQVLSTGSRILPMDGAAHEVAMELGSLLEARGWSTQVAEPGVAAAGPGDIVLELEAARGWPLGDARFGELAFALAIEDGQPLQIRARTPDGLRRGYAMLTRSIGPGSHHQHLGVRMQRSICHGGAAGAIAVPVPVPVHHDRAPLQQTWAGETTADAVAMLPSCFYVDCPLHTGYHRVWYGRADCWQLDTFLRMAAVAGAFQPSHSRRVRRLVTHSRSDHKMLQLCRPGPAGAASEFATVVAFDANAAKVQLAVPSVETVEVPLHQLRVPVSTQAIPTAT